ncbi:SURF1 family protein [Oceanicella actignis]|uniref:SURF1-like protein n=1 Tax=Oceanicella actignis TaxID=1189325 RepID=A0A1M7TJH6_9RHOB|nr:SURF1 family protein [Oceanicella actignis]SET66532.1 surfeit locus 1 family protein [Oceanicella actignis]SHN70870.1 surfeit locus 1 family protein [Oceanicella actignis]
MARSRAASLVFAIVLGAVGAAILVGLGTWQLRRLAWKEGLIATLEQRLSQPPAPLPQRPVESRDEHLRVRVEGARLDGPRNELHVLTSLPPHGPGFRVIVAFETDDGRRILVDRGFVPESLKNAPRPGGRETVTGALLWPDEGGARLPPDAARGIWFARDVPAMARALDAEPVLVVAETAPEGVEWPKPQPVTVRLRNDHLQYAVTWFSLAAVWLGMTAAFILRIRRDGRA